MFNMSESFEMAALEIGAGKNFRILIEERGVRRRVFCLRYGNEGSVYTETYIPNPVVGSSVSRQTLDGQKIDLANVEWSERLEKTDHKYVSFHGTGRVIPPGKKGAQSSNPSRQHLGFRLKDIREPKILCHHLLPGPDIYPQEDVLGKLDTCFNNIGKQGHVPMFTVTAMPFFSPADMAIMYPRDGKTSVGFITKRLPSGIKILVRVSLDHAPGNLGVSHHVVLVPASDMRGGLILPR